MNHKQGHADVTCHTSNEWAHKSDPIKDRIISDRVAFMLEIGLDPNETLSGTVRHGLVQARVSISRAVVVVTKGQGQAHDFLRNLAQLVKWTKPKVGVQFQEQATVLALNVGADVGDDGLAMFEDGTKVLIRKDGAMLPGMECLIEAWA